MLTKLDNASTRGWWKVRVNLNGVTVDGFVNASFLATVTLPDSTQVVTRRACLIS